MRFISTRTHAVNDYIFGMMLVLVPLFFYGDGGAAVWVPIVIGIVLTLQSLITNYEFSLANMVPVKVHLLMDALAGLILIVSPWLFGFSDTVWRPHVIVGALEIGLALFTHTHRDQPVSYPNPPRRAATTPSR